MPTWDPPQLRASTSLEMKRVNKVEDFRVRLLALNIVMLASSLVSFQRGVVMDLTSTLSHLCEMNYIARYIICRFGFE